MAHLIPPASSGFPVDVTAKATLGRPPGVVKFAATEVAAHIVHAIREFVTWYYAEPRLALNRTVVLRYWIHLEQQGYAPATINLRLAAVRRIAYEAADAGLLSPELAAGIRRVKGLRRIGVLLGNWLTPAQGRRLLESATPSTERQLRDHARVAMLNKREGEIDGIPAEAVGPRANDRCGGAVAWRG
jgi:hypothetical protein